MVPPSPDASRRIRVAVVFAVLQLGAPAAKAATPTVAPGTRLESLVVGAKTYRNVEVRSINDRTLVITHAGGMCSIKLRDLAPEWQERFGYDPDRASAADARLENAAPVVRRPPSRAVPSELATAHHVSRLENLVRSFGQPAAVQPEIDLRPKFFQLELGVKSQGRRPSCAVFAIVSALEFQNAELIGRPEKLSEEYLIWATRKTVQRISADDRVAETDPTATADDADEGFALAEVVGALRGYGIPLQTSMPNTFGRAMTEIAEPPPAVVDEARAHQRIFVLSLPGRDNETRINNLVHALNAGMPVPVGMAWPHYRSIRSGSLMAQQPMKDAGHAVTLVGYRCASGRVEDVVFVFKNSWGVDWGQGGYGTVTYEYLRQHLHAAVLLDVLRE